jgi:hypothetical protein
MCQECEWEKFVEYMDNNILGDPDFDWATDTLEGIRETVEEKEHITDRQREAVENIEAAVERRR